MARLLTPRTRLLLLNASVIGSLVLTYSALDSKSKLYPTVVMPLIHLLNPESSHILSIYLASKSIAPWDRSPPSPELEVSLFGKVLENPIGLAAGYDKHGEAINALMGFGFGMVEIGSVTPKEQVFFKLRCRYRPFKIGL